MKYMKKLNCMLLITVILVSCIYTNKNHNSNRNSNENSNKSENNNNNNNDIEELMYAESNTERADTELNKFFEKESNKYDQIDNYVNDSLHKKHSNKQKKHRNELNLLETSKAKAKGKSKGKSKGKKAKGKSKGKKTKKAKKYPNAKLLSLHNPYYPKKTGVILSNTSASYCKFKKGFLHLVKNASKLGPAPLTIKTVPVYVNLNMYTLSLQMGLSLRTQFDTIKVRNILKVTKKFRNANCFEIIEDKVIEKTLAKSPIVLCAGNPKILFDWVKALQEFKDCLYNTSSKNDGSRTLMDFNRINTLIKVAHPPAGKKPKAYNPLYYNAGPPVAKKKKSTAKAEYIMKKQLAGIVGLLERGQINKQKLTRKMNTKLRNAKKIEYDIRSKQNMINKILNKRQRKEKQMEIKIRNKVHKKRELQLLKAVKSRIRQYKVY